MREHQTARFVSALPTPPGACRPASNAKMRPDQDIPSPTSSGLVLLVRSAWCRPERTSTPSRSDPWGPIQPPDRFVLAHTLIRRDFPRCHAARPLGNVGHERDCSAETQACFTCSDGNVRWSRMGRSDRVADVPVTVSLRKWQRGARYSVQLASSRAEERRNPRPGGVWLR